MKKLYSIAEILWRWGFVLWVCRVAVVSAAAGGILLAYTAQARDMFADLGIHWWQWIVFFFLLFAWAWIVHASARHTLQYDDWVPESHAGGLTNTQRLTLQTLYWKPALYIPRALSLVIFSFVAFTIFRVWLNLHTAAGGLIEAAQAVRLAFILLGTTAVVAIVYMLLLWKHRRVGDWVLPTGAWSREPPLLAGTAPPFATILPPRHTRPTPVPPKSALDIALIVTRVVVLALLLVTIFNPLWLASWWPRLFFIPLLLGGCSRAARRGGGVVATLAHALAAGHSRGRAGLHLFHREFP